MSKKVHGKSLPRMITEAEGTACLAKVFRARGYTIVENIDFTEGDVSFNIDGWDAKARVGYEYRTSQAGDKEDLDADELLSLAARMERGELFIMIVDDTLVRHSEELAEYAERFLDVVERRKKESA